MPNQAFLGRITNRFFSVVCRCPPIATKEILDKASSSKCYNRDSASQLHRMLVILAGFAVESNDDR